MDRELWTGVGTTSVRCTHDALGPTMARIEGFGPELPDVRLIAEHPAGDHPPAGR